MKWRNETSIYSWKATCPEVYKKIFFICFLLALTKLTHFIPFPLPACINISFQIFFSLPHIFHARCVHYWWTLFFPLDIWRRKKAPVSYKSGHSFIHVQIQFILQYHNKSYGFEMEDEKLLMIKYFGIRKKKVRRWTWGRINGNSWKAHFWAFSSSVMNNFFFHL